MHIQKLIEALQAGDKEQFIANKYPEYQEGDSIVFEGVSLNDVDLSEFPLGFTLFKNCNFNKVKLSGLPIGFLDSKVENLDITDSKAIIYAQNSDFTRLVFNENSVLGSTKNESVSVFVDCIFPSEATEFFKKQNVLFTNQPLDYEKLGFKLRN